MVYNLEKSSAIQVLLGNLQIRYLHLKWGGFRISTYHFYDTCMHGWIDHSLHARTEFDNMQWDISLPSLLPFIMIPDGQRLRYLTNNSRSGICFGSMEWRLRIPKLLGVKSKVSLAPHHSLVFLSRTLAFQIDLLKSERNSHFIITERFRSHSATWGRSRLQHSPKRNYSWRGIHNKWPTRNDSLHPV